MKVYFDNKHGDRHWLAEGIAHRQSVSGLRISASRDVQISKPVRSPYQIVHDRVTVATQVAFTVTYYFTKYELLGNPSHGDLERATAFVFEIAALFSEQSEGLLTFISEADWREAVRQYRGLMTSINPQQIGATVRVPYVLTGADFIRPE